MSRVFLPDNTCLVYGVSAVDTGNVFIRVLNPLSTDFGKSRLNIIRPRNVRTAHFGAGNNLLIKSWENIQLSVYFIRRQRYELINGTSVRFVILAKIIMLLPTSCYGVARIVSI